MRWHKEVKLRVVEPRVVVKELELPKLARRRLVVRRRPKRYSAHYKACGARRQSSRACQRWSIT